MSSVLNVPACVSLQTARNFWVELLFVFYFSYVCLVFWLFHFLHSFRTLNRYSYIDSFVRLFVHSFIRSLNHRFVRSLIHSFIYSFIHPFIHSFIQSSDSVINSRIHPFCLSACMYVCLSVCLSVRLTVCFSVCFYGFLFCFSVSLFICLCLSQCHG